MSGRLRTDTALYAAAVLLDRLLGFLMLPFLTRAIAPQDYGAWTQTAVTAGMLVPLVVFGFPTAIVRYFSGAAAGTLRRRFFDRLGAVSFGLYAGVAAIVLPGAAWFALWAYGSAAAQTLLPALLGLLAADAGIEFALAWQRAAGRMGAVAGVLMLRSVLRYGALLVLVGAGSGMLADWLGRYAALQCGFALLVLAATRWRLAAAVDAGAAAASPAVLPTPAELWRFCAPLVLLAGFTALNAVLDRYVLLRFLGLETVAVYAAAVSLASIPMVFHSVLGFTLFPVLARHWSERRFDEASRLMGQSLQVYLFLCLPVALAIALSGAWALPLLATAHYRAEPAVFALLGLSVLAFGVYQILLYALLLDGRSLQVLVLAVAATAINLVLNLALAPRFGAAGAAAAVAASNLVMALLAARLARAVLPWRFPWAATGRIAAHAALAGAPLAWAVAQAQPSAAAMAGGLAAGALIYFGLDWARPGSVARSVLP